MAEDQQIEVDLGELENRLERVRVLYEQYFMGIEKREPGVQRKDVERRIQLLRRVRFPSTAARFKFQTTVQRFNTLQQYWNRTCREIENGTYRRHILRAERRLATKPPEAQENETSKKAQTAVDIRDAAAADLAAMLEGEVDLEAEMKSALSALEKSPAEPKNPLKTLETKQDTTPKHVSPTLHLGKASLLKSARPDGKPSISPRLSTSPKPKGLEPLRVRPTPGNPLAALDKNPPEPTIATKPKAGPPPAPSMRPRANPSPAATKATESSGLSADRIKSLHASYVEARKKTNASAVSYEKLEKNLRETEQKLRAKHKGRQVDFDVSIKDGKAILKPRLK